MSKKHIMEKRMMMFFSKFLAVERVTMEAETIKKIVKIHEIRSKKELLDLYSLLNYLHEKF